MGVGGRESPAPPLGRAEPSWRVGVAVGPVLCGDAGGRATNHRLAATARAQQRPSHRA